MWHSVRLSPRTYHWSKWKSWAFSEIKPASEPCSIDYQATFSLTSSFLTYHFESEIGSFELKTNLHAKESWQITISAPQLFRSVSSRKSSWLFPTHPSSLSSFHFSAAILRKLIANWGIFFILTKEKEQTTETENNTHLWFSFFVLFCFCRDHIFGNNEG